MFLFVVVSRQTKNLNSLCPLRSHLYLFLRVLRVLRGQIVCHHEEHEGHEVWVTVRAKNAKVTKILLRPLRLCGELIVICVCLRKSAVKCLNALRHAPCAMRFAFIRLRLIADVWLVFEVPHDCFPTKLHDIPINGTAFGANSNGGCFRRLRGHSA